MAYDFTTARLQAYGLEQQKVLSDGHIAMFTSDANSDISIQTTDFDSWFVDPALLNVYNVSDFYLDGSVQTSDYDKWFFNKAKLEIAELEF